MTKSTNPSQKQGVGIRIEGLHKAFPNGRRVFENLNIQIAASEFVAVVGPSGCGKSTLLRLLAGLETPTAGTVTLEPSPRIGFVFQEAQLLPWRNVSDNVALPLELCRAPIPDRESLVRAALSQVGMERESSLFPSQLSGGMKMRISLARALVQKPSLLLLDEPFAALDELTRVHLEEEVRVLWALHGMTIVLVTHSFTEAVFLADRILILSSDGRHGDTLTIPLGTQRNETVRQQAGFTQLVHSCRTRFEALQRGRL